MNTIKKRQQPFTSVSNEFLRDDRISFKAKGLFCYMFSMSDGWNFTIRSIATQQKDGHDSIQSALEELKQYGYVQYEKHSNGTGTYHLDDEPKTEKPNQENPIMGKSLPIKKEQLPKNKNNIDNSLIDEFTKETNAGSVAIELAKWFITQRKKIKHPIKTIAPIKTLIQSMRECINAGYKIDDVKLLIENKEWQSLKLEWVVKELGVIAKDEWSVS